MKNDTFTTNYLASAKTSKYDGLQRRVSSLIQHWMDHTSKLKESKIIPLLCDFIESTRFPHFRCNEEDIFSTKSDFFLGRIIQFFIEIQDGEIDKNELTEKRQEIETILNKFSILNHTKIVAPDINLQDISNDIESKENSTASSHTEPRMEISWWLKVLSFFSRQR